MMMAQVMGQGVMMPLEEQEQKREQEQKQKQEQEQEIPAMCMGCKKNKL